MPKKVTNGIPVKAIKLKPPGLHADGAGLYLNVSATGSRSWIFRFMAPTGKRRVRAMGLGSVNDATITEARDKVVELRRLVASGIDPIDQRARDRGARRAGVVTGPTFREVAASYIADRAPSWKNAKSQQQWENTLSNYAYPVFGDVQVSAITTDMIRDVLRPIWSTKNETAGRLRGRIEKIIGSAIARGLRTGDNPARWDNHLENLLPPVKAVKVIAHHVAAPYAEVPSILARIRAVDSMSARALEFAILTCARTGEVIGARWSEIDFGEAIWTVPAERMKAKAEHRVPLTEAALAVLRPLYAIRQGDGYVFPGQSGGSLGEMALRMLLKRMGLAELTVHGFRSSFTDWTAETTDYPAEVRQMALAHVVDDKVEAAYRRGDLFAKRRALADAWAAHCAGAEVIELRTA
jgi:integrase